MTASDPLDLPSRCSGPLRRLFAARDPGLPAACQVAGPHRGLDRPRQTTSRTCPGRDDRARCRRRRRCHHPSIPPPISTASAPTSPSGPSAHAANPRDFISSTRWAASEIDLARATERRDRATSQRTTALDAALAGQPRLPPGRELSRRRSSSRSTSSRTRARPRAAVLADAPGRPGGARHARRRRARARRHGRSPRCVPAALARRRTRRPPACAAATSPSSRATRRRPSTQSRSAVTAAIDEELEGSELAWYRYQLGDTLVGDRRPGRAPARHSRRRSATTRPRRSLTGASPGSPPRPRTGTTAIDHLDAAIAVDPLPGIRWHGAPTSTDLRGGAGDDRRERPRTARRSLAIGQLAGEAPGSTTARCRSTCRPPARTRRVPCGSPRPSSSPARTSTATMPSPGRSSRTAAPTRPGRRWRRRWRWAPGTRSCSITPA